MRIKHNIKRYWTKLEGYILDTIFEDWEQRCHPKRYYSEDGNFCLWSVNFPELRYDELLVFWHQEDKDYELVSYTYDTEDEAQKMLDYINEFTIDWESEQFEKLERVFITDNWNLAKVQGEWTFYFIISSWYIYPKRDGERAKENLEPVENIEKQVQEKILNKLETFKELFNIEEERYNNNNSFCLNITFEGNKSNRWILDEPTERREIGEEIKKVFNLLKDNWIDLSFLDWLWQRWEIFIREWWRKIRDYYEEDYEGMKLRYWEEWLEIINDDVYKWKVWLMEYIFLLCQGGKKEEEIDFTKLIHFCQKIIDRNRLD